MNSDDTIAAYELDDYLACLNQDISLDYKTMNKPSNPERWNDAEMIEWLFKLDKADCEINNWEAEFLESFVSKEPEKITISSKQRACIVRMANKYLSVR